MSMALSGWRPLKTDNIPVITPITSKDKTTHKSILEPSVEPAGLGKSRLLQVVQHQKFLDSGFLASFEKCHQVLFLVLRKWQLEQLGHRFGCRKDPRSKSHSMHGNWNLLISETPKGVCIALLHSLCWQPRKRWDSKSCQLSWSRHSLWNSNASDIKLKKRRKKISFVVSNRCCCMAPLIQGTFTFFSPKHRQVFVVAKIHFSAATELWLNMCKASTSALQLAWPLQVLLWKWPAVCKVTNGYHKYWMAEVGQEFESETTEGWKFIQNWNSGPIPSASLYVFQLLKILYKTSDNYTYKY